MERLTADVPAPRERRARWHARVGSRRWVLTLTALTGVTALSIDMSLPAQPTLVRELTVTPEVAQLTLGLFLVGFAVGQLVGGLLSDAVGRKPVLMAGLAVFVVAGAACAAAGSIGVLLAARVAQGFGASAAPVMARAMVRDTQAPADAARVLSTILAVLALAPMLAPLAGSWLLAHAGWPAIFASLAGVGVTLAAIAALTLAETHPPARRRQLSIANVAAGFGRFFRARGTRIPTLVVCLSFAGQFAFIADSPFVLIDGFGVSADVFGYYFAATALALMIGSVTGRRQLIAHAPIRVLTFGSLTLCVGGALVAAGAHAPALGPIGVIAPAIIYFFGIGLTSPSATAIAMQPVPEIAGLASATIGALTMLAGASSGFATTRLGGDDPRALGAAMAIVGGLAALAMIRARQLAART